MKAVRAVCVSGTRTATRTSALTSSTSCTARRAEECLTAGRTSSATCSRSHTRARLQNLLPNMCFERCFSSQGGAPSPFDRNFSTKIAAKAVQWISQKLTECYKGGKRGQQACVSDPGAPVSSARLVSVCRTSVCQLGRLGVSAGDAPPSPGVPARGTAPG